MKDVNESINKLTTLIMDQTNKLTTFMMDQTNISTSSPAQKDTTTTPDPNTTVQTNRRAPPLKGEISDKIGGMWTLKHEISSPRFYELLIKIELKGDTALDLKNLYNHVKMSLNAVTRLIEELLPDYLSINKNSDFKEYIVLDSNHISYSWNLQVYDYFEHSLLVAMTNETCVKSSIAPQA